MLFLRGTGVCPGRSEWGGFVRTRRGCGGLSWKVERLNRSLYGLKLTSIYWHKHLVAPLKSLGFEQILGDPCGWIDGSRICLRYCSGAYG